MVGGFGPVVGRHGVFHTPRPVAVAPPGRVNGGHQLLRHAAARANTSSDWSISIASMPAPMRLSVGAVNVRTGNFVYFDNTTHRIGPEHIMASGALPPGFPAVEIDGEHYWDGGLVSNTPLDWVVDSRPRQGHAGVPGRSVERARRVSAQHGEVADAAEGDPVFQPHPRKHRPVQTACSASPTQLAICSTSCRRAGGTARRWNCLRGAASARSTTSSS